MVPLLFLSKGLRNKEDNENNRKREKRNEIQYMILIKSSSFVNIWTQTCLNLDLYKLDLLK